MSPTFCGDKGPFLAISAALAAPHLGASLPPRVQKGHFLSGFAQDIENASGIT